MRHIVIDVKWVIAFCTWYALAFLWGVSASLIGIPIIAETGGYVAETIWAGVVTLLSGALIILPWFDSPNKFTARPSRSDAHFISTIEQWTTLAWVAVVGLYPVSIIRKYLETGDSRTGTAIWAALLLVVFPSAQFVYLAMKNRKNSGLIKRRKKPDG